VLALAGTQASDSRVLGLSGCSYAGPSRKCAELGSSGSYFVCKVVFIDKFNKVYVRAYSTSECRCCYRFRQGTTAYGTHLASEAQDKPQPPPR